MTQSKNRTAAPAAGLSGDWLTIDRLRNLLDVRKPSEGEAVSSLYLKPGETVGSLEWRERLTKLGRAPEESGCGLVCFRAGDRAIVIAPPFPVTESGQFDEWNEMPLWSLLNQERTVGVVLVRLGRYSVAVYRGGDLSTSKTDSRYVKGKHHAGGTSQLRYTRIREGQMRRLYVKVCESIRDQFEPVGSELDFVVLGGEKFTLNGFLKVCPRLDEYKSITLKRRLNIRDPKRDTLDDLGNTLHESRVWGINW
ncbi:MAG: Vms1/Ankzf1 family peptidyl-tRNA hydrolase [Dehalococcoidia bacterium]|nr:Vms1/Ankzf1 family peptidyl-tRNA hydrolase [Dehalococcoidia bacterium]